ncbi:uncharacterized protein METZ01_LOCUS364975, partial [marine metagenome]
QVEYANAEFPILDGDDVHTATCGEDRCSGFSSEKFDTDDDCASCTTNTDCYDDCGICTSTGAPGSQYGSGIYTDNCGGDVAPPSSCTATVIFTSRQVNGDEVEISMDCGGTCSNFQSDDVDYPYGSEIQTFYEDDDEDGLGDPDETVTVCNAEGAPDDYVTNDDDLFPDCEANYIDCNGDCGGDAYLDPHFGDDDCEAAQGHPECVGGDTDAVACVEDCNGDWGGTKTNHYYYYDLDSDDYPGREYGYICLAAGMEDAQQVEYNNDEFPILGGDDVDTATCGEEPCTGSGIEKFDTDDDCASCTTNTD